MKSTLRFIMDRVDEAAFIENVLRDPEIRLVDGPYWTTPMPTPLRSLETIGNYCIIWSKEDQPILNARELTNGGGYYCGSEHATIQFLRSQVSDNIITQGSIAICTSQAEADAARGVERRYRSLRRFIKQVYRNSIIRWYSIYAPFAPAAVGKSANPGPLDPQVWVGPSALGRLQAESSLRIRQFQGSGAFAFVGERLPDNLEHSEDTIQ